MARTPKISDERMSHEEWQGLPVTITAQDVARASGACLRYVQDHAADLGGSKFAGKWVFSKAKVAEMLGL